MFGNRLQILRLAGIPIYLDLSWLFILLLITWSLEETFRQSLPDYQAVSYWVMGLVTAVAFFVCILLHELGHSLVARSSGIPIRGITLFLFGGVAEMTSEPPSAAKEFWMAIAGPVVSLVLGILFLILALVGNQSDWSPAIIAILEYLGSINLVVLAFNLIPGFPLDGGRVLRSILWASTGSLRKATRWAAAVGQGFAWFLIAVGVYLLFSQAWITGIWFGLIGLFLNNAARASYQQVLIREGLKGEPVSRFMNPEPIVVPPDLNLRTWVEDYVYRYHRKTFPVAVNGRLQGVITTRALQKVPREEWDQRAVGDVMIHDLRAVSIRPETDALDALAKMQQTGHSRLLVTDGEQLIGIVSLKDLLRFLQMKMELEPEERERTD
jgi:Zn-dependent protease/CBS domain-containing protein